VKLPQISTKAGQFTWYQVLTLAASVLAYVLGAIPVAVVFLLIGTLFGILASIARVRQAQAINRKAMRAPRRRR
jgi:ABC-type spermidine/putrescine transport system permease subunit II